jgi:pimeloyl-ACP methyl ester carboxylesterase
LLLENALPIALHLTAKWWWWRWINPWVHFTFDARRGLRHVRSSTTVWIIEGDDDVLLSPDSGTQLVAAVPRSPVHHIVIPRGRHNNLRYCDAYQRAIVRICNETR